MQDKPNKKLGTKKESAKEAKAKEAGKLIVYNTSGNKVEEVATIFDGLLQHQAALSGVVKMYLANKRKGLASTKTRGEVSGGGKKPWKQKGTGRARVGSSRNPLWRHGGVVFGPHRRDYRYKLSAKVRNIALKEALNEKNAENRILVLDNLQIASSKTKEVKKIMDNLKINEKTLFVVSDYQKGLQAASGNMPQITISRACDLNALDVLNTKKVVLLKDTLGILKKRLN